MRKYLLLIPFLLFAGEYGKIIGKVVDSKTGEPIYRADVVVENANRGASTNENGEYKIFYVPVGTYSVTVTHQDYNSEKHVNTEINSDESTVLDFHLDFVGSSTFFEKYISKYVSDNEIKEFSDSLIVIYDFTLKQLDNSFFSEMKEYDLARVNYRILRKLVEIGDIRAESLALKCSRSNNLILKDAALHVFADIKSPKGVEPLLHLLKWGPLTKGPVGGYVTLPPGWTIYEGTVMWAITQIGEPALPYLKTAIADTTEEFKQRVAILISRIGTEDSILKLQAGTVLTEMIDSRQDSMYLEKAIRGVERLGHREAIPSLFAILLDTTMVDGMIPLSREFGFTPNRIAALALEKFGYHVDIDVVLQEHELYLVYDFNDLSGKHYTVVKHVTEKQGLPANLDEQKFKEWKESKENESEIKKDEK